jgi:hypothetical protein
MALVECAFGGGGSGRCVVGTLVCLGLLLEKEEKEREGEEMLDKGECLYVEYYDSSLWRRIRKIQLSIYYAVFLKDARLLILLTPMPVPGVPYL